MSAERTKLIEKLAEQIDRMDVQELERVIAFAAGVSGGASCIKATDAEKAEDEKTGDE